MATKEQWVIVRVDTHWHFISYYVTSSTNRSNRKYEGGILWNPGDYSTEIKKSKVFKSYVNAKRHLDFMYKHRDYSYFVDLTPECRYA